MAFQLPAPLDPTEALREQLRQRLAILQQPTFNERLAPGLERGLASIGQGVGQGIETFYQNQAEEKKRASVAQAMKDASDYVSALSTSPQSVTPELASRGNSALLMIGKQPIEWKSPQLLEQEAEAKARGEARGAGPRKAEAPKPPPGYRFLSSGNLEPIPGGPAAGKAEKEQEKQSKIAQAAIGQADKIINKTDQAMSKVSGWTTGYGSTLKGIPGTPARNLASDLQTIKANLGFAELQAMRQSSPTGGALGSIAVAELDALQATVASLDQAQSAPQLRERLEEIKTHYQNWKNAVQQSNTENGAQNKIGRFEVIPE